MNATNGNSQGGTAEKYMGLLERAVEANDADAAVRALQLSLYETERWRQRMQESREIRIDENGSFVVETLTGLQKLGEFIAGLKDMIPQRWREKPGDCAIAAQMAMRLKIDVITLLQNAYSVHGTPGVMAQLLIGLLNKSGEIEGVVDYEHTGTGDEAECRAVVTLKSGKVVKGPPVSIAMAKANGWADPSPVYEWRDGQKRRTGEQASQWLTMPTLRKEYRAAALLIRTRFPHLTLGLQTKEELEDVHKVNLSAEEFTAPALLEESAAALSVLPLEKEPPAKIPEQAPRPRPQPTACEKPPEIRQPEPEPLLSQPEQELPPGEPSDDEWSPCRELLEKTARAKTPAGLERLAEKADEAAKQGLLSRAEKVDVELAIEKRKATLKTTGNGLFV